MSRIYYVFDLGPGDGGKGGVVHKLSCHHNAHTVIKVGGAQGSHGVLIRDNQGTRKFAFSQWGCGTFEGVDTHISSRFIVSPTGLLNEADGLRYLGVDHAWEYLTVDERAICATGYHGISSRLNELARGDNPRGTIGSGIGVAYRDSVKHPELIIRAGELKTNLRQKLSNIRDYQIAKLSLLDENYLAEDLTAINEEKTLLKDNGYLDWMAAQFLQAGKLAKVVGPDYLKRHVFNRDGATIIESSHGMLTDSRYGFKPHTSAIRTLPAFTHKMLADEGFSGEIINVGVHRAYTIRHGAGPMPTANSQLNEQLLPGSHKDENRWQGKVRVGPLDLVLLRYAIEIANFGLQTEENPSIIDWLAITWFDQIGNQWQVCDEYNNSNPKFFSEGRIKIVNDTAELCSALFNCEPKIVSHAVPESQSEQFALCNKVLREKLNIPVGLVSFGPTENDTLLETNYE